MKYQSRIHDNYASVMQDASEVINADKATIWEGEPTVITCATGSWRASQPPYWLHLTEANPATCLIALQQLIAPNYRGNPMRAGK